MRIGLTAPTYVGLFALRLNYTLPANTNRVTNIGQQPPCWQFPIHERALALPAIPREEAPFLCPLDGRAWQAFLMENIQRTGANAALFEARLEDLRPGDLVKSNAPAVTPNFAGDCRGEAPMRAFLIYD